MPSETPPLLQLLNSESMMTIIENAYDLLQDPGFFLYSKYGLEILAARAAAVDFEQRQVRVKSDIISKMVDANFSGSRDS